MNYIFDFGNVLAVYNERLLTEAVFDPETEKEEISLVSSVIFDRLYFDRLDMGTITDEELKESAAARLPENLRERAMQVYDRWIFHLPLMPGMKDLVKELKAQGHHLYVLSNISIFFAEHYREVPELEELFSYFDGQVFSGPIHIIKPQPEIFSHLTEKYGLKREECIFVDDNPGNIEGAEKCGIHGVLYRDTETLRKELGL